MNEINLGYSQALFEIAEETNKLELFLADSKSLLSVIVKNPGFVVMYMDRHITKDDKKKSLKDLFANQLDNLFLTGLMLMIDQDNFYNLEKTLENIISLINKKIGIKEGIVYSATELDKETINKVEKAFGEKTNTKVELRNLKDGNLIGGIKVVLEDKIYDNSIETQLKKLKLDMMKGSK